MKITSFPFEGIKPITSVRTVPDNSFDKNSVRPNLSFTTSGEAKKLYVVLFGRPFETPEELTHLLHSINKQVCKYSPSYLLGLMAKFKEADLPKELADKDIVAMEPQNPESQFLDHSYPCYLGVRRMHGRRELEPTEVGWEFWVDLGILAEDLPQTMMH